MFIPYRVDVPMARLPIANWVLIGITIVVSIAMFGPLDDWSRSGGAAPPELRALLTNAGMISDAEHRAIVDAFLLQPHNFHLTQLFGNLMIHAGFMHLAGNMLFLFVFGNAVNAKLGHGKFLLLYFGVGLVESLAWLAMGSGQPTLGASGAIMGIVGAYLFLYPLNDVSCGYMFTVFYRGVFQISGMWVIAGYVAFDIWGLIRDRSGGVAYLSHVVGFLVGAGTLWLLLKYKVVEMEDREKSLLQVWGMMPHHEDNAKTVPALRGTVPVAARPAMQPVTVRPPPRRKPVDEGPIPLD